MDLTVFLEINLIIVYYNNMLLCVQQMFYFPFKNKFPLVGWNVWKMKNEYLIKLLLLNIYHKLKYIIFQRKFVFYRQILPPEHSLTLMVSSQLTTGIH